MRDISRSNLCVMNFRWLIVIVPVLTAGAEAGQELGAEYEKLSWFLHITDLHISSRDQARLADLATSYLR